MPIISSIILAIGFAIGNIVRVPLATSVTISILDICVISLYVLSFFTRKTHVLETYKKNKSYVNTVLLFGIVSAISLFINGHEFGLQAQIVGLLYLVRWLVYAGLPIILPRKIPTLPIVIAIVFPSLIQYLFVPDIRFMSEQNWDPHFYRVVGSLLDPGFTGLLLVFVLLWLWIKKFKKLSMILVGVGAYIALALTYSRSSYIAFMVAVGYVAYQNRSAKLFLKIATLFIATIMVLPRPGGEGVKLERTSTIQARIQNWSNTVRIASDYPLLGTGFNVYRYAQRKYGLLDEEGWEKNHAGAGADSSLLFVLATTGIVGLVIYMNYLSAIKKYHYGMFFILPLLIHSWFLNSLFFPPVMALLAVLVSQFMDDIEPKSPSD